MAKFYKISKNSSLQLNNVYMADSFKLRKETRESNEMPKTKLYIDNGLKLKLGRYQSV